MRYNYGRRHGKSKGACALAYLEAAKAINRLDAEAQIAAAKDAQAWLERRIRGARNEADRERRK